MSGHSKFANIKHKKERNDVARGKTLIVIDREIVIAVREGGVDLTSNSELRDVTAKVKADNTPSDTTDRGIKRAVDDANSVDCGTLTYEGYDPNGVAIIVDILTDSKGRTVTNVRNASTKGGDSVDTPGSVSYMFDKRGQIIIGKEECGMDPDKLIMLVLDAGAEDFSEKGDSYEAVTVPKDFSAVRKTLEAQGTPMMQADVIMIPQTWMKLTDGDDIRKLNRTLDLLDEDDDVQVAHYN